MGGASTPTRIEGNESVVQADPAPVAMGALAVLAALVSTPVLAQESVDLETILGRVGARLERRYERSQRIVSTEMVSVQSFDHDNHAAGLPRRLEFERREEWGELEDEGVPIVTVRRQLRSVNGREPTERDLEACLNPRLEAVDPLSDLLPARQRRFAFSLDGVSRVDSRRVARLEFVPKEAGPGEVTWDEDCVSISLRDRARGRVWVDVETGDVLRLDQHLWQRFEFREPPDRRPSRAQLIVLERDDLTIHYEPISFEDPADTLMLPRLIEHSWWLKGAGFVPRYLRTQQFSNHRRFLTDGRVVDSR